MHISNGPVRVYKGILRMPVIIALAVLVMITSSSGLVPRPTHLTHS